MDRAHALIEKYFEGVASPEELAELAECLRDPSVADVFARRSRLEASLHVHFQQEANIDKTTSALKQLELTIEAANQPRAPRNAWWRWAAVAASVMFIMVAVWWLWSRIDQRPEIAENPLLKPPINDVAPDPETITIVSGNVHVDGREARAARNGELMRVVSDTPAILAMSDGSQAKMEPASQVIMQGEMPGARQVVHLLEGAGTFKVQPGNGQFQVETEVGRVIVLGTEFRVKLLSRSDEKERVFPGTHITGLAVIVTTGVVQVDLGGKSHVLTAGQDRLFRPEREAGKGIREMLAVFESGQQNSITVRQGGDRPKLLTFPLAADARVTIDGKPATLSQLTKGTAVYLQRFIGDDEVIGVRGEGPTITGSLLAVDPLKLTLTLSLRGGKESPAKEKTFSWLADVKVVIHGEPKQTSDLLSGMQLVLKLSVDTSRVLEIVAIRGKEKKIRP